MQQRPLGWLVMAGLVGLGLAGGVFYWRHPPQSSPSAVPTAPPLTLKGAAVEGALLSAADGQGHTFNLKLETAEVDPKDGAGEVYLYTVLYQPTPHLPWQNLCAPDAEGVAKALPLTGQWDAKGNYTPQGITLACTNGALAKCVRWGYKPWKTDQDIPWRDLHQACTRMVRADYCGDGVSHTQQGVNIDIYDDFGIQRRTPQSGMVFEAAWGLEQQWDPHSGKTPVLLHLEGLRNGMPPEVRAAAVAAFERNVTFIDPWLQRAPSIGPLRFSCDVPAA